MIEQALEAEVDDALGRQRYERTSEPTNGYRNGKRMGHVKNRRGYRGLCRAAGDGDGRAVCVAHP